MKSTYSVTIGDTRSVSKGDVFRHFKGTSYYIIGFAQHTETDEILVIYTSMDSLYCTVWARPISMFMSPVDKNKYPQADQAYRFEFEMHFDSIEDLLCFKSITY